MIKQPIHFFDNTLSTGLDLVPEKGFIHIDDAGSGSPKAIILRDNTGITNATTIGDLLDLQDQFVSASSSIPLGAVLPIVSSLTGSHTIPATGIVDGSGFMYCDGSVIPGGNTVSGTSPDLTDGRFLRGSTSAGGTGGADSFTLAATNMPEHTHTIDHDHPEATTGTDAHTHTYSYRNLTTAINSYTGGPYALPSSGLKSGTTGSDTHSHTFNVPPYSGSSGSAGSGTAMSHIPKYVNVQYIIKVN